MSAGTRWFCVMKRKTVTVNAHVWGFRPAPPRPLSVGRGPETHSLIEASAFVPDRFGDLFGSESEKPCPLLLLS